MQSVLEPASGAGRKTLGTVIVTGGASGLGKAIASAISRAGGTPITFDLRPHDAPDHRIVDCGDRRAIEAAVAEVARDYELIDAVVANAGVDACGEFESVPADEWERVITVNLVGTAALVRAALPHMEHSDNPRIVTVASTLGLRTLGAATAYCASKFGVVGFTRALTLDLAGRVGVTLLCPGGMKTDFFEGREEQFKPAHDAFEKFQLNDPANVADTVVFALTRPRGVDVRELVVTPSRETSWP